MNLPPYVFDVDYVAKIRSELSITVLEKKTEQNYRLKKSDLTYSTTTRSLCNAIFIVRSNDKLSGRDPAQLRKNTKRSTTE